MKRRDFLKLIGLAPLAPSVLAATPKYSVGVDMAAGESETAISWSVGNPSNNILFICSNPTGTDYIYDMWKENEQHFKDCPAYQYQWLHIQVEQ